jgi:hypothetical protein
MPAQSHYLVARVRTPVVVIPKPLFFSSCVVSSFIARRETCGVFVVWIEAERKETDDDDPFAALKSFS